jgi:hypothetical protein
MLVADGMAEMPAEVPLVEADVSMERLGEADAVVEAAVPVVKLVSKDPANVAPLIEVTLSAAYVID